MDNKEQNEIKETLPNVSNIKTTETYTLPSKGLVYDPQDNIPASITLRRMTTKEDKMRMRNESQNKIKKDLLQACITNPGIDVGKLKTEDANFLLLRLRSLSLLNDKYKVNCRCGRCGTEFVHEINLSEVPINYLSEEHKSMFKVTLPISGQNIQFKYPSLDNMIRMGESLKEYRKNFPDVDVSEILYTSIAVLYIDKINETKPMLEELEDWMDDLDILDSRAINDIIEKIDGLYGISDDIKTKCPKCGSVISHGLPITNELFTPSR